MQVDLDVPTILLEVLDIPLPHKKRIYEDVIDDKVEYDVALINSKFSDSACNGTIPLPKEIAVDEILDTQTTDSQCQYITPRIDAGKRLYFEAEENRCITSIAPLDGSPQFYVERL